MRMENCIQAKKISAKQQKLLQITFKAETVGKFIESMGDRLMLNKFITCKIMNNLLG